MAKPIPFDYRQKIVQFRQSGKTFSWIATQMPFSLRSIKRIWSQYQKQGEKGLLTHYHQSGRSSPYDAYIRSQVEQQKDGEQGAPYIRSVLLEKRPGLAIPHERTIQRWWKAAGVNRPKGRPRQKSSWSEEVHHTWQIDGKEQIELGSGRQFSWMKVADEASGSDLLTQLFPHS